MKSLCFILILLLPFAFFSCTVEDADVEENPPGSGFFLANSHYVQCSGVVTEAATHTPIQGMRLRITKSTPSGGMYPNTDSLCETITNEFGEYSMKFWYDAKSRDYLVHIISDSTLLPNPDYHNVGGLYNWTFYEGQIYKTDIDYRLDAGIANAKSVTFNPKIEGYGYVTLRLKQKSGYEEPMTYAVLVNDTVVRTMKWPIFKDTNFGETLVFLGFEPRKVEIRVYRNFQSNKYLTKTITPVPTKLIVEEFEF